MSYRLFHRWLDEGTTSLSENAPDKICDPLFQSVVKSRKTNQFSELCRTFPTDSEDILLAYAQSASLLYYIQSEYGNRALSNIVAALPAGAECDNLITRSMGISLDTLNREWLLQQGLGRSSPEFGDIAGSWW